MTTTVPRTGALTARSRRRRPDFLWLDLTRKCPLACVQCYNDSGPTGTAGTMTLDDWRRVITEAAAIGVAKVELIGGEPTHHPDWSVILDHALTLDLDVAVYSNLFHVRAAWWPILERPRVSLATSWYSDLASEHDRITGRPGSHARTRANIAEAVRRGIPIRAGMTKVLDGQRIEQGRADLIVLGVPAGEIRVDRTRRVGRAAGPLPTPLVVSELCGHCGDGRAAVMPDGRVAPCVVSSDLVAGNVLGGGSLRAIFASPKWVAAVAHVPAPPGGAAPCQPNDGCIGGCGPTKTNRAASRVGVGAATHVPGYTRTPDGT